MAKRIITISREFGSGGRLIGEEVAKKLGAAYYDKDVINFFKQATSIPLRSISCVVPRAFFLRKATLTSIPLRSISVWGCAPWNLKKGCLITCKHDTGSLSLDSA